MANDHIDIHQYDKLYKQAMLYLSRVDISKRNKNFIQKFDETLSLIDQVSLGRRTRVISYLINLARVYLKMDFDKATKEDLKQVVKQIDDRKDYSLWTRQGYRVIIKKFYRWLAHGDEYNSPEHKHDYPSTVAWITCSIRGDKMPMITAENILTENEIIRILEAASDDVQHEAMIAVLYESGCRIGEHGGVRLKHIKQDGSCFTITVSGKTGTRETFIVKMAGILANWLNNHPARDDPNAPLWVKRGTVEPMMYTSFTAIIKRIAQKAGIKKRIYPHIFRHSRATHAIVQGEFSTEGAKTIFGWSPDSQMLKTYIHITSADIKDRYLEKLGLINTKKASILDPKICAACKHPNLFNASICEKCHALLDSDLGIEMDKRMLAMRKFLHMLSQDSYIKFRIEEMARDNSSFFEVIENIGRERDPQKSPEP